MAQCRRQIFNLQWRRIVLILQKSKRVGQTCKQRLLKQLQFFRMLGKRNRIALQHRFAKIFNRIAQGNQLRCQICIAVSNDIERGAKIAVKSVERQA